MKIIKELNKIEFKRFLYDIDVRDEKLYDEINNPDRIGIFQMVGSTASRMIDKIKPKNFEELNAVNAFARPGTMDFADDYVNNRESGKPQYPEAVSSLLEDTNDIILYQESVMEIFNKVGGFSLENTNTIRGIMKKLSKADKKKEDLEEWDKIISQFQKESQKQGVSKREATRIAGDLLKMSSYMFNKSHSTSYTYTAIMTLYLSIYLNKYFYSATLHYEASKDRELLKRLKSVRRMGFSILPPDINKSKTSIAPVDGESNVLIFGLNDVKFVGEVPAQVIMDNAPYEDFIDFVLKTKGKKVTIRAIRALVSIGAFDGLYDDRKRLLLKVNKFWEEKKSTKIEEKLRFIWDKISKRIDMIIGLDATVDDLRDLEREFLGFNFFITPFTDEFLEKLRELKERKLIVMEFSSITRMSKKVPLLVNAVREFRDKNDNEMAFLEIEDIESEIRSIPMFASIWQNVKKYIIVGKVHMMNLYLDENNMNGPQIMFGRKGFPKASEQERFIKRLDKL